jgi:hypothetical protein
LNDAQQQEALNELGSILDDMKIEQHASAEMSKRRDQQLSNDIKKVLDKQDALADAVVNLRDISEQTGFATELAHQNIAPTLSLLPYIGENAEEILSMQRRSLVSVDALQMSSTVQHSQISSQISHLSSMVDRQAQTLRTISSSSILIADDGDALSRLIHAELRSQLQPMAQRLEGIEEIIRHMASSVLERFQSEGVFSTDAEPSQLLARESSPVANARRSGSGTRAASISSELACYTTQQLPLLTPHVRLFRNSREWRTRLGIFRLGVKVCRTRSSGALYGSTEKFFELQFDFIPPMWLSSIGLSVLYSTGSNSRGYYDICPSILPIRVIPSSSSLWDPIRNDDIIGFRKLLESGALTFKDVDEDGENILEAS